MPNRNVSPTTSIEVIEPGQLVAYAEGHSSASDAHPDYTGDAFFKSDSLQVFGVFGGVSDNEDARVAPKIAVDELHGHYRIQPELVMPERIAVASLNHAFKKAHLAIAERAAIDGTRLGTTGAAMRAFMTPEGQQRLVIAHRGDTRAYRLGVDTGLAPLTTDHMLASLHKGLHRDQAKRDQLIIAGATGAAGINNRQRRMLEMRSVTTHVLGSRGFENPQVTTRTVPLERTDRFVLASYGIHQNLPASEIENILRAERDPKVAARNLAHAARDESRKGNYRSKAADMTALVVNVTKKR